MIPLHDINPRHRFPFVTIALIGINSLIYLYQLFLPETRAMDMVRVYGAIPASISNGQYLFTIITSMFLHGGFLHLIGNMLYLYIFGDNVESVFGSLRFLIFYLLCGILAFASHYILDIDSAVPMIGASGAISGVLGAYALKFPRARVKVLVPLFIWIWRVVAIPAAFVLGFWFVMQLSSAFFASTAGGGVAWMAHVGGFVAGLLLMRAYQKR